MANARRTEGEPHDRLTRLTAVMTDALDREVGEAPAKCKFCDAESFTRHDGETKYQCLSCGQLNDPVSDIKCIVFLDDGKRGGIQIHGYEDDLDAMTDLFVHLKAICEAQGKTLQIHAVGQG